MLEFNFMRNALIAGFFISVMVPLIGVIMVNRRTSMVGDALSHTSLTGVGMGLILGFDPVIGAVIICIVAAFIIEGIRKKFPQYGDMATAVTMSTGLGIAAILSDFAPGGNDFESYLFGSISSVTSSDLRNIVIIAVPVICASLVFYASLLDISIDANLARLSGVPVKRINSVFTFLSAITIALACKVVGALMVASLIVLPVATALMVARSYKQILLTSLVLGVIYTMTGIVISYYVDLKPGGAIVINAVIGMFLVTAGKRLFKKKATA